MSMLNPRLPQRTNEVPIRAIIPNLLTTAALCCGLASLHYSIKSASALSLAQPEKPEWNLALAAILFSAVFDTLDGRAARLLNVSSRFGAVLDSLSDFVSFGIAPAMLLYLWLRDEKQNLSHLAVVSLMVFALCSALRLARFTSALAPNPVSATKNNPAMSNYFLGMPTPAAAGAVLIPVMLDCSRAFEWRARDEWIVVTLAFVVSALMISRRKMFAFKKMRIQRRFVAPLLVLVGFAVVMLFLQTWITLACVAAAYLLSLPLSELAYRRALRAAAQSVAPSGYTSTSADGPRSN